MQKEEEIRHILLGLIQIGYCVPAFSVGTGLRRIEP
jgi:hypothetical protein